MCPKRIHSFLRTAGARHTIPVGPFLVPVAGDGSPAHQVPVALPADRFPDLAAAGSGPESPAATAVAALLALYAPAGRPPRIGYLSPAPAVDEALAGTGYTVDRRYALMRPSAGRPAVTPSPGIRLAAARGRRDLIAAASVRSEAIGCPGWSGPGARTAGTAVPGPTERLADLATAGTVMLARDLRTGAAVAAGRYTTPRFGVTEISGVWVAPAWRGRGLADAVCAALTRQALDRGCLPFLRVPVERAARYRAMGYQAVGEVTVAAWRHPVPQVLRTPRVRLLPLTPATADRLLREHGTGATATLDGGAATLDGSAATLDGAADTLDGVTAAPGWPYEDTAETLRAVARGAAAGWLITVDGTVIGQCGTVGGGVDRAGDIEIGYGLAEPYRGLGYGGEAVPVFSRWLLADPFIRRVVAATAVGNTPSRRVLQRAGFTVEAVNDRVACYALSGTGTGTGVSGAVPAAPART